MVYYSIFKKWKKVTYRDLGILPVLWLVGTWGGKEGVGPGDKLIGRPGYGGGGDFFGGIGGRSLGDLGTDFWGIGGSFLGGLVAVFFRGEADLRVGWRQFFEKL